MIQKFLATALVVGSMGAHAALTPLAAWDSNLQIQAQSLTGVLFNTTTSGTSGAFVALGAHAYKNGISLPNNGLDTFQGQGGIYVPDGLGRANWSFDFAYNAGGCSTCTVWLRIDTDPSAAEAFVEAELTQYQATPGALINGGGGTFMDSWNLEMAFLGINFDPFAATSTGFELVIRDQAGVNLIGTDITVNVPEPGSLALVGLALAGLGMTRRRKA